MVYSFIYVIAIRLYHIYKFSRDFYIRFNGKSLKRLLVKFKLPLTSRNSLCLGQRPFKET